MYRSLRECHAVIEQMLETELISLKRIFSLSAVCLLLMVVYTPQIHAAPTISAEAGILLEASSQSVLLDVHADDRLPMASTTKIMTALVALENCPDLSRVVQISEKAVGIEGSSVYLKAGEKLTMEQLLHALLLESANDAAAAIAIEIAGDIPAFSDMMNETANRLGLNSTHFTNPHGLDHEEHYTTAHDLAVLTCHALQNPDFARIVSTYKTTIPMNEGEGCRVLVNHNRLLRCYDGAVGVKTGYTKRCGRCLVSAAQRNGITMVAVTLNAPDDWQDHTAMLDYGFSRYTMETLAEAGQFRYELPCLGGTSESITAVNSDILQLPLPVDHEQVSVTVQANRYICAPVRAGDSVGILDFYCGEKLLASIPLFAQETIDIYSNQRSAADLLKDWLRIS